MDTYKIFFQNHKIQPTNITVKVSTYVKPVGETEITTVVVATIAIQTP